MNQKNINTLLLIASAGLAIAGIIFLTIALCGNEDRTWLIASALSCSVLSNLFFICAHFNKKKGG